MPRVLEVEGALTLLVHRPLQSCFWISGGLTWTYGHNKVPKNSLAVNVPLLLQMRWLISLRINSYNHTALLGYFSSIRSGPWGGVGTAPPPSQAFLGSINALEHNVHCWLGENQCIWYHWLLVINITNGYIHSYLLINLIFSSFAQMKKLLTKTIFPI